MRFPLRYVDRPYIPDASLNRKAAAQIGPTVLPGHANQPPGAGEKHLPEIYAKELHPSANRRSICYTATIPYFLNDIALTSTHAPHRDETHHRPGALGVESVMQRIERRLVGDLESTDRQSQERYPFALHTL